MVRDKSRDFEMVLIPYQGRRIFFHVSCSNRELINYIFGPGTTYFFWYILQCLKYTVNSVQCTGCVQLTMNTQQCSLNRFTPNIKTELQVLLGFDRISVKLCLPI